MKIPAPLTSGPLCPDCGGTGANRERTLARPAWEPGFVRCVSCQGNGLDPLKVNWPRPADEPASQGPLTKSFQHILAAAKELYAELTPCSKPVGAPGSPAREEWERQVIRHRSLGEAIERWSKCQD